ncbi:hypothetical protein ACQJBY_058882 [Aegilops geniculata]
MTAPALALAMVGCCATGRRRCARPHSVAASPSPHSLGAQQEGRCSLPGLTGVVAAPPSSDPATAAISILAPSFFQCRVDGCHGEDADGGRGCGLQFKARASGTELAPTFRCELQLPKGEHVSSMAVITKLPSFAGTSHISNSNCTFIYCCSHVASSVSFKTVGSSVFCLCY